jgi:hypothetical protein
MDINTMMQGYVLGATIRTACTMLLELMFTIIPQEKERVEACLNHEMTSENWEDYWQYWGERTGNTHCLQRAEDRERIRRLAFGKETRNPEVS